MLSAKQLFQLAQGKQGLFSVIGSDMLEQVKAQGIAFLDHQRTTTPLQEGETEIMATIFHHNGQYHLGKVALKERHISRLIESTPLETLLHEILKKMQP